MNSNYTQANTSKKAAMAEKMLMHYTLHGKQGAPGAGMKPKLNSDGSDRNGGMKPRMNGSGSSKAGEKPVMSNAKGRFSNNYKMGANK